MELLTQLILAVPAVMLGWAAIRRAEALVIWAKRRSPNWEGRSQDGSG
jgi:hypothetical protein